MPASNLRFRRLSLFHVRLPFRLPFRHAGASRRVNDAILLRLTDDRGTAGVGEAVPRAYLTGETVEGAVERLRRDLWPRLKELAFTADGAPHEVLKPLFADAGRDGCLAAYAGLDLAVYDAWAHRYGVPGDRLFGAASVPSRPLTAVIGLGMPAGLAARLWRLAGFRDFKVKVGGGARSERALAGDLARVDAVRRAAGAGASIRVDANGGWTDDEAAAALRALAARGVACVEEPCGRGRLASLIRLAKGAAVPLMADESLCSVQDAEALLPVGAGIRWNLRLAKVGGFTGLLELAALARTHGIPCQLGALVGETSILTAAARACLGITDFRWVESAFPRLLLRTDPVVGGALATRPVAAPLSNTTPGLGVALAERAVKRLLVARVDLA